MDRLVALGACWLLFQEAPSTLNRTKDKGIEQKGRIEGVEIGAGGDLSKSNFV